MTHKVARWTVIESQLYEAQGEDGPFFVFDSTIVAETTAGLFLCGYGVLGYVVDEDGLAHPNHNYKNECLAIIARLVARGDVEIDEKDGWTFLPPNPSLETCLAAEANIEHAERHNLPPIDYSYTHYSEAPYMRPEPEEFVSWRGNSDGSVGVD